MPPIRNTISRLAERIIAKTRASIIARHPTPTLRRLYPRTPLANAIRVPRHPSITIFVWTITSTFMPEMRILNISSVNPL